MKKIYTVFILALMLIASNVFGADVSTLKRNVFNAEQTFKQGISVDGAITLNGQRIGEAFSNVWYVSSVSGADTLGNGYGKSKDKPFGTLNYAIGQCRAGYGDVIIVLPSHNEGITGAAEIDLDVAGIFVIGVGTGDDMPTIDFDNAAASVAIGADNIYVSGIRFRTSANAVVVGLDIEDGADDAVVENCQFGFAEAATDEFAIALRTNDATNRARIINNEFHAGAQAAVAAILFNKDTDSTIVKGNWITGTYSTAPIMGATTASTNLLITENYFFTAGSADTFNLVAESTGIVSRNLVTMNATSAAAAMDVGNCLLFNNYIIADDDVGGAKAAITDEAFASITGSADD